MSTPKVLHLRSQVKGKLPAPGSIQVGQIGVNYNAADPFVCIKDSNGTVRRLDGVSSGTIAPLTPNKGQLWVDNTAATPVLKLYDGTAWVVVDTVPVAATTAVAGVVQLATAADVTAGAVDRVVTAAELKTTNDRIVAPVQANWTETDNTKNEFVRNKPTTFTPPIATASQLGGVKQGTGIAIAADGTIRVNLTGGLTYKGQADPTVAPPAGPADGDIYLASTAGAYEAGWGLTGIATSGEMLIFEGGKWDAVGQASAPVKANWTAAAGAADEILNKPVIPTAATIAVAGTVVLADAAAVTAGTAGRVVDAAQLKKVSDAVATAAGGGISSLAGTAPVTVTGTGTSRTIAVAAATNTVAGLLSAADKTKLDGIAAGSDSNVQSDWGQADNTKDDFIKNKPAIPAAYTLPTASATIKGGVQVGTGLAVSPTGVLSNSYSYTLPAATAAALGGVKVGNGLSVTADGTLSVAASGALTFKGSKAPTDTAPTAPAKGDTYVMSVAGKLHASWTPLGSTAVALHEVVAWDGTEWLLLGSAASTAVTSITASAPLSATGTAAVALTVADATNVAKGVIRIATNAEATGGTLETVCVTPGQLHRRIPDGTKADEYLRWDQATTVWVAADTIIGGTY